MFDFQCWNCFQLKMSQLRFWSIKSLIRFIFGWDIKVYTMLLLTESVVHTRKYLLWRHAVRTERSEVRAAWRHNKYFPYGPNSRLIRALLYTHTSKTTKSQCFPLLLWTEVQPVHTPVRTQAYGQALSQSNFSILSVFCLVYNNKIYRFEYLPKSDKNRVSILV